MLIDSFDYFLPKELIANEPASPRDACKLMFLTRKNNKIEHKNFHDLVEILKKGDVLVLNKSKVIPARLLIKYGNKEIEIFLVKRVSEYRWEVMVKPGKLFRLGFTVDIGEGVNVKVVDIMEDGQRVLEFSVGAKEQNEYINKFGNPPYPPYIKEPNAEFEDYQTIYAVDEGSLAAPTAGLHFTDALLDKLRKKGVHIEFVTLHVGLGTFLPVKTREVKNHKMHKEDYYIDESTCKRLNLAKKNGARIVAVGTTSIRVLEDNYDEGAGVFMPGNYSTDIFIYPGYKWKCIDGVITNFHLPKSTLLLLVSSFAGKDFIFGAYDSAIKEKYRFYSFGDAMLIL